ncbi:MAG: hypothetical protein ACKVPY_07970 [Paracoccaceae bacterium]
MMRAALAFAVLLVAGCSDPSVGAGLRLSPSGLSIVPTLGARIGGLGVSVSP